MFVEDIFHREQIRYSLQQGIYFLPVLSPDQGLQIGKTLLTNLADNKTAVFLSGGKTPAPMYQLLAQEEKFAPGVVGMVDERYGEKFHAQSNELMIQNTGLLRYLTMRGIMFHPILQGEEGIIETTSAYDATLRNIFNQYQTLVALMGLGSDGHTAGLLPQSFKFQITNSNSTKYDYVSAYEYPDGLYKQRISMTFLGLSMLDLYIILAFGEDKKEAILKMFDSGSEEEIPARFYLDAKNKKKTVLITDQELFS